MALTKRQGEILNYIAQYMQENEYAPSLEEIKERFQLTSKATVHQHLTTLEEKGFIHRINNSPRAIEIVSRAESNVLPMPNGAGVVMDSPIETAVYSPPAQSYIPLPLNEIICGDAVEVMAQLPDNSVDVVVTSPPYDLIRSYHGFSYDLHKAGEQIFRILKSGGIAVMVIQDQSKNFGKTVTSFRTIVDWVDNIGFKLFETVIYRKYGAEGAWWTKRFRVDHEYMPIFLKGERPQHFNKEPLKIPSKWGGQTLIGGATRLTNGKTLKARPIKINPLKCRGTIWEYLTAGDGSRLKHKHPATFPDKIPVDFIQCFCPEKGVVLDPYIGSGTTAVAAKKLGRDYIGIDISKEYCNLARQRIKEEASQAVFPLK